MSAPANVAERLWEPFSWYTPVDDAEPHASPTTATVYAAQTEDLQHLYVLLNLSLHRCPFGFSGSLTPDSARRLAQGLIDAANRVDEIKKGMEGQPS